MKSPNKNEHTIQSECVQWFREIFPEYLIWSIPNEAAFRRWSHFELAGALRGVPDVVIVIRGEVWFVEFKTNVGEQSDAQQTIGYRLQQLGHMYRVIRSLEAFKALFD